MTTVKKEKTDTKDNNKEVIDLIKEYAITDVIYDSNKFNILLNNKESIFIIKNYQRLLMNFFHPTKNNNKILINWQTGVGKTLGSILLINQFIKESAIKTKSNVIVIGYTSSIFKKDILKFHDIGLVSKNFYNEFNNPDNIDIRQKLISSFFKKFENKELIRNVSLKFYGYKYLYMQLFNFVDSYKINTYDDLLEGIKLNKIRVDKLLLKSFENSLVICDEIHNVYNESDSNTRGLAILYILKHVKSLKIVYLSATPISKSQQEIVHLLNLLNDDDKMITMDEIFTDGKITEKGENIIRHITNGKISYYRNNDLSSLPDYEFVGENITGIKKLKFRTVEIDSVYESILKTYTNVNEIEDEKIFESDNNKGFIDDLYIKVGDKIVNSIETAKDIPENDIFTYDRIKYNTSSQPRNSIIIKDKFDEKIFAPKYYQCILDIIKNIKDKKIGKTIIYHNKIINNGILLVKQLLLKYGFVFYGEKPTNKSLCMNCGNLKESHIDRLDIVDVTDLSKDEIKDIVSKKKANTLISAKKLSLTVDGIILYHNEFKNGYYYYSILKGEVICKFTPAIFVTLAGNDLTEKILQEYNSPQNAYGSNILILVGSVYIKESIDFNCIRYLMILSRPYDISSLIQIRGRSIRNNSHVMLPKDMQNVKIYIYVNKYKNSNELTYELEAYKIRMDKYIEFKYLEKLLYENSINNFMYTGTKTKDFDQIVYDKKEYNYVDNKLYYLTFGTEEIKDIKRIIKAIFLSNDIIEYNTLISEVKSFGDKNNWYIRTDILNDDLINTALYELIYIVDNKFITIDNNKIVSELTSIINETQTIFKNNKEYVIMSIVLKDSVTKVVENYLQLVNIVNINSSKYENLIYNSLVKTKEDIYIDLIPKELTRTPKEIIKKLNNSINKISEFDNILESEKLDLLKYIIDLGIFSLDGSLLNINKISQDIASITTLIVLFIFYNNLIIEQNINLSLPQYNSIKSYTAVLLGSFNVSEFGTYNTKVPSIVNKLILEIINILNTVGNLGCFTFKSIFVLDKVYYKVYNEFRDIDNDESQYIWHSDISLVKLKENEIIIGFYAYNKHGDKIFKLREPIHMADNKVDSRKKKKGINHEFERKEVLIDYILKLSKDNNIYTSESLDKKSTKEIGLILLKILKTLDINSRDGTRYFIFEVTEQE